jgi:SAM-dependent methyltransferase
LNQPRSTYDVSWYESLAAVEDTHFWFHARNQAIATLVAQVTSGFEPGYRILEIGCGTGNVLRALAEACPEGMILGMDLFADGLVHARRRLPRAMLVRGDALRPPFGRTFDLVGMFDVLEHLEDDSHVLRAVRGLVGEGRVLVVTVPAARALWSYSDEAARHFRRYEPGELRQKLVAAGFEVEFLSPYMASLYPILWAWRRIAPVTNRRQIDDSAKARALFSTELNLNPILGSVLGALLGRERTWLRHRRRFPFGSSLIAVARRATG